ncbi:hypothetical protein PC9H_008231 [Pleurotus ostreatus]|uniref:Pinin/SDK/MemA protein domain-containing protein n=1 Tax=Pleurotus ostreatus TaxID=5322 RepID=A0A8H6ZWE5_PLEOS|nr:uncharacterized protein PC9H_008231 [Pleurotus ostreatus]KAF7428993.1 hypothetical protein PC9H_008231 [Pleurotus ostreatus]KAJ8697272.1 hypothetical protein PTI98_007067 [Pleurotus ostreatus]
MSTTDTPRDPSPPANEDSRTPTQQEARKRPRLNLNADSGRERKRGKSMFGILLGTLNKAKIEDKERNASEAAKKRQLIEKRLQSKLQKETDSVRRAEEAKKDKTSATRKEEELQLKDSVFKLRRKRLPLLANFLLTSDVISADASLSSNPLAPPPRTHPPPLYYLPAILTPEQEAFLARRRSEVSAAAEKEWQEWKTQREEGVEELKQMRQRVAKEIDRTKDKDEEMAAVDDDEKKAGENLQETAPTEPIKSLAEDVEMEVDDSITDVKSGNQTEQPKKDESVTMQGDDDDAVEY